MDWNRVAVRAGGGGRRPYFVLTGYDGKPTLCQRWLSVGQGGCPLCTYDDYASGRGDARLVPTMVMRRERGVPPLCRLVLHREGGTPALRRRNLCVGYRGAVLFVLYTAVILNLIVPHEWKINPPLIVHSTRPVCSLSSHRKARSATEKTCGLDSFFTRATGREYFTFPVPSLSSASYTQKIKQNTRRVHGKWGGGKRTHMVLIVARLAL